MKSSRRPKLLRKPSLFFQGPASQDCRTCSHDAKPELDDLSAACEGGCAGCTGTPTPPFDTDSGLLQDIFAAIKALQCAFETRLAHDAFRQEQIDRLHQELQEHKRGLLHKIQRPYIMGLIQLHDNLGRSMDHLQVENEHQSPPMPLDDVRSLLRSFQEDIEMLMEQNAIFPFAEDGDRFDPVRQTSLKTVPTADPKLTGRVAQRVRPGFEQEQAVVQKERVCVYTQPY